MANIRTVNRGHLYTVSQKLFCLRHANLYVLIIIIIIIINYYSKNVGTRTKWSTVNGDAEIIEDVQYLLCYILASLTVKQPQTAFSNNHRHLLASSGHSDDRGQNSYNNIKCY